MDDHLFFTEFVVERLDIIQVCEKAQFIFYLNGKRIAVSIFADLDDGTDDEERKSVEERMIELITAAWDPYLDFDDIEDLQLYERSVDKAAEMVMDIGRVPFSQIAPPLKQHYEYPTDLHHKLFPETFDFRLETIHDTAFMIPITSAQAAWPRNDGGPDPNFKTDFEPDPQLPRYSTKDITFVHKCREGRAQQVQIGSETMLCKAFTDGLEFDYLAPELIALQKIEVANANLEVPLRIPLLKGYVTHPTTGAILGFVRSWIPPSQYGNSLEEASSRMSSIPRHRWACGIDPNNDTWLIDFAGGFTMTWVNKDIAGTEYGDKHALFKLKAFLLFSCPEISEAEKDRLFWGCYEFLRVV